MKYETLYDGAPIPALGLGTWRMGGGMEADRSQDEKYRQAIRAAIEMGYTHIDTAEMYGSGHTEEMIGHVIKGFDRERLFIATKVWSSNLRYRSVLKALEGSLRRLGTDYVDLYLIHWPNPSIPLDDTFKALNELVVGGKTRRVGVSNFDLKDLQRAQSLSATPIATNQVRYSLLSREPERNGVLKYCQDNHILLTAYSPLKEGVLSIRALKELAQKYDATPAQVALSWLLSKPRVISIPMSTNIQHLKSNLDAVELELAADDIELLNRLI
jgi:diketogulonate reductase-like aldo/keto reductase